MYNFKITMEIGLLTRFPEKKILISWKYNTIHPWNYAFI